LVPTKNGEARIGATIESLEQQTVVPARIIAVCDNCTDGTEKVVRDYQRKYGNIRLLVTQDNCFKKAGALNQVFKALMEEPPAMWQYAVMMDDDTVLDPGLIAAGLDTLTNSKNVGAVCSRAGVIFPEEKLTLFQRLIWYMQHIEYGLFFDSSRVQTLGHIKVVHGMAAMYSRAALEAAVAFRKVTWGISNNQVYCEGNITEDYELTITTRRAGFKVTMNPEMKAWTSVPLSFEELWRQRKRWLLGGIDALCRHGMNDVTWKEYFQHSLFVIFFVFTVYVLHWLVANAISGGGWSWHPITFLILGIIYFDQLYRAKYVQDRSLLESLLVVLFIPFALYHMLYQLEQLAAYVMFVIARIRGEDVGSW